MYISSVHSVGLGFLTLLLPQEDTLEGHAAQQGFLKSLQVLQSRAWESYLIVSVLGNVQSLKFPTLRSCY